MNLLRESEFVRLLQKEQGRLLRVAWLILGQEADAWDVLQSAVEQAWIHRAECRGGSETFPAWIRRIVTNLSLTELRRRRRVLPIDPHDLSAIPEAASLGGAGGSGGSGGTGGTGGTGEPDLTAMTVQDLLQSLDANHRQVVALRYLADLPLEQIAAELDLPLGTVKSRLNRAVGRLRQVLAAQEDDERRVSR